MVKKILFICLPPLFNKLKGLLLLPLLAVFDEKDYLQFDSVAEAIPKIKELKGKVLVVYDKNQDPGSKAILEKIFEPDENRIFYQIWNIPECLEFCVIEEKLLINPLKNSACFVEQIKNRLISLSKSGNTAKTARQISEINKTDCCENLLNPQTSQLPDLAVINEQPNEPTNLPTISVKCKGIKELQKIVLKNVSYFISKTGEGVVEARLTDDRIFELTETMKDIQDKCFQGKFLRIDSGILINMEEVENYEIFKLYGIAIMKKSLIELQIGRPRLNNSEIKLDILIPDRRK